MRSAALSAIRGRPKRKTAADPNGQGRLERAGRPDAHARIKNTNRRCAALSATRRHRRANEKYLDTLFQPIFGIYNVSRRLFRHITVRSVCGRADAASRRHRITAPPHHGIYTAHGTAASRHRRRNGGVSAEVPADTPFYRDFIAFCSRATVSLRRSARSAGWRRLGVGCPRPRSGRPSTRVRPRPRRPAAARRRRRMG